MGKNTSSAKKAKKSKKGAAFEYDPRRAPTRDTSDPYQFYARIVRTLGNCRFTTRILLNEGEKLPEKVTAQEVLTHLPKSRKRGGWLSDGMIVLISHRVFEHKADIIYKYKDDEVRYLQRKADMPSNLEGNSCDPGKGDIGFTFDHDYKEETLQDLTSTKGDPGKTTIAFDEDELDFDDI